MSDERVAGWVYGSDKRVVVIRRPKKERVEYVEAKRLDEADNKLERSLLKEFKKRFKS